MIRQELDKYIQQNISEQGTMSGSALSELVTQLIGYVPYTIYARGDKTTDFLHSPAFTIISSQDEINSVINSIAHSINFEDASVHDSHAISIYVYDALKREGLVFNSSISLMLSESGKMLDGIELKTSVYGLDYTLTLSRDGLSELICEQNR